MAARQADRPRAPVIKERKPSPYELIKTAITTGEIAPGAPLVEAALAEWCQVSRTPVREALTRLEQDGLVIRSVRGLIVRERSPEEILDIYETRIALESTVARIAAARRTPIDLIHLRRAEEAMSKLEAGDENAMAAANREFHQALWRSSHNGSLIDLLSRLDLHLARYPPTTLSQPGRWDEVKAEHKEILAAIEAKDESLAESLARKHFTEARDIRLAILASSEPEDRY
jgi:DNA-binding GntR family transcriptional regulator